MIELAFVSRSLGRQSSQAAHMFACAAWCWGVCNAHVGLKTDLHLDMHVAVNMTACSGFCVGRSLGRQRSQAAHMFACAARYWGVCNAHVGLKTDLQ